MTVVVGGREQDGAARALRQRRHAIGERQLERAHRRTAGQRPARQLQQGERDALGRLQHALTVGRRQALGVLEQLARGLALQPAELEHGGPLQPGRQRRAVTHRQQQGDRLGLEPARDEHERVDRRAVEPLEVVDQAQDRLLLGRLGQQGERGGGGQEAVAGLARRQPERGLERRALQRRQASEQRRQRPQELVQAGERELGLGLDALRPQQPQLARAVGGVLEQRGLADAGDAAHDQHAAVARARRADHLLDRLELGPAADQHGRGGHTRVRVFSRARGLSMAIHPETRSDRLLERDAELEAIGRTLAQAAGGTGGLVMVDGPAGLGKTSLLDAARAAAAEAGLLTLRARGAELERAFAFGVVRQLFDEILRDEPRPEALLTGAARFAAPVLGVELEGTGAVASDDPFAARHALYWLTANLSADRPLALFVDDAHWADTASLGVLAHIALRLEGIAVALVVASRTEETQETLDALRRHAAAYGTVLPLAPLSEDGSAAVIRSLAPAADAAQCRACYAATGGNPFLLHEVARSAAGGDGGIDPALVAEQSPDRVTHEIEVRLARLPEPAVALARAAAILGGGIPLRPAAALAEVEPETAAEAVDQLVAAGVLRRALPHELLHPLEFVHPLVRAAVYDGLGPAGRSRDHMRAARLLDREAGSPERVAAQLLRCQPDGDPWAYGRLVVAAQLASARGAADAATLFLRRALDEPPPPDARPGVLLDLATAEFRNSEPGVAIGHLREAMAGALDSDQRFRATMLLASLLGQTGQVADAVDLLEKHVEALGERPDLRAAAEAGLVNVTRIDPATRPRAARVVERLRRRVDAGEEDDHAVLGTITAEMGMAGEPAGPMADMAERALEGLDLTIGSAAAWSGYNATRSLVVAERYDKALQVLERALTVSRQRGAVLDVGGVLTFRTELYLQIGDIAAAEVDARSLGEIANVCGWPMGQAFAAAWLGEVLVERGELDEAEAVLPSAPAGALPDHYPLMWALQARARLRMAQGRPEEAADDLREASRRLLGIGHRSPAIAPWRSMLAEALVALGERDEARRLVAEELELAHPVGARRPIGIALRAMAHVEDDDIRLLRDAAATLDASEAQLERARAHADLGVALRRAGEADEAREHLRLAVDIAHRCGADALEDRALTELRAAGARPRRRAATGSGSLTPSERRIAELAASGSQNREIAQTLYVTTATVEFHLRNAYRKLGISGRPGLADALT